MSEAQFFATVRPLFGTLAQSQVDGCKVLLKATEFLPLAFRAYLLATTFHETAKTMRPISEYGGKKYFHDMYDIKGNRPHVAKRLGNTEPGDGVKFHGRGYVQITGRANYVKAGKVLGVSLVERPALALEPKNAAEILVAGCTEGWFTGKKLGDYLGGSSRDYVNARRVVNGKDKAKLIASYAVVFEEGLRKLPPAKLTTTKQSPVAAFFAALLSLFKKG